MGAEESNRRDHRLGREAEAYSVTWYQAAATARLALGWGGPIVLRPTRTPVRRRGMDMRDGFVGSVGNTPLIKLRRASEETGCTILGKAEFLNPGGSVKDRAALFIIKDAEERGLL